MERLALPEPGSPYLTINSDTIFDYFADYNNYKGIRYSISSNISLGVLKPSFLDLYQDLKEGYVFDQKLRDSLEEERTMLQKPSENAAEIEKIEFDLITRSLNRRESLLSMKGEVERSKTGYFDLKDGTHWLTSTKHGQYDKGEVETFDLAEKGYKPTIEIHTHPKNALFSPVDYARILLGDEESDQRLLKGAVVLCPDYQLLAIATPDTKLLNLEETATLIELYDDDNVLFADDVERNNWLEQWYFKLFQNQAKWNNKKILDYFNYSMEDLGEAASYPISDEEKIGIVENYRSVYDKMLEAEENERDLKFKKVQDKLCYKYFSQLRSSVNRGLLDFARFIEVRLFMATDMENFKAFSA